MPMRRPRPKALQPNAESLEGRLLLSKTISGTDLKGDTWSLTLTGPGDLLVTKQNGPDGKPAPLNSHTDIKTIEVAGGDPISTRLDGTVTPAPGSDGRVLFQQLEEIGGKSERLPAANGINTIEIPGFWLANTNTAVTLPTTGATPVEIRIPDGVEILNFGGVDATINPPPANATTGALTANTINVDLGLPFTIGTSIIVNKVISGARIGPATGGTAPTPTQDSVTFTVLGRLNLFQADEIDGSTASPSTGFQGGGGTIVISQTDPFTTITGQIGDVRIGGNATDFATQTNGLVSNFYIGGETNNIFLLAPGGSRNIYFGKGMDTVTIDTHTLENLNANRGALNSNVTIERSAGRILIGGDVVGTKILSGYTFGLGTEFTNQTAGTPVAQDGGGFTTLVGGNVTNSVFAASVQPFNNVFGSTSDLILPTGHITAKVEGTINNTTITPDSPTKAFYAKSVKQTQGPIIPPIVPESPFPRTVYHHGQNGLTGPRALFAHSTPHPAATSQGSSARAAALAARQAAAAANAQARASKTGKK
jgi:hypothetical protein